MLGRRAPASCGHRPLRAAKKNPVVVAKDVCARARELVAQVRALDLPRPEVTIEGRTIAMTITLEVPEPD